MLFAPQNRSRSSRLLLRNSPNYMGLPRISLRIGIGHVNRFSSLQRSLRPATGNRFPVKTSPKLFELLRQISTPCRSPRTENISRQPVNDRLTSCHRLDQLTRAGGLGRVLTPEQYS